jgi:zinc finger protein 830
MATKVSLSSVSGAKKKIDSPLAKYNSNGQLFCVLCNSQVKNEMFWTGHINGKAHREQVLALKSNKGVVGSSVPSKRPAGSALLPQEDAYSEGAKRSRTDEVASSRSAAIMGPPKSIMKQTSTSILPASSSSSSSTSKANDMRSRIKSIEQEEDRMDVVETGSTTMSDLSRIEEALKGNAPDKVAQTKGIISEEPPSVSLPAGFFDDAKEDAKARGIEYRNPEEAEWERFVKEIATEEVKSSVMRTVDEEESAKDRELDEIEEQMKNWQRYK